MVLRFDGTRRPWLDWDCVWMCCAGCCLSAAAATGRFGPLLLMDSIAAWRAGCAMLTVSVGIQSWWWWMTTKGCVHAELVGHSGGF